jgi:hypothetical protein
MSRPQPQEAIVPTTSCHLRQTVGEIGGRQKYVRERKYLAGNVRDNAAAHVTTRLRMESSRRLVLAVAVTFDPGPYPTGSRQEP